MSPTELHNDARVGQLPAGSGAGITQAPENQSHSVYSAFNSLKALFSGINFNFSWPFSRTVKVETSTSRGILESHYVKTMSKESRFLFLARLKHSSVARSMDTHALVTAVLGEKMDQSFMKSHVSSIVQLVNGDISPEFLKELLELESDTLSLFFENFDDYTAKIDRASGDQLSELKFPMTFLTFIKAYGKDFVKEFKKENDGIIKAFFEDSEYYKDKGKVEADIAKLPSVEVPSVEEVGSSTVSKVVTVVGAVGAMVLMPALSVGLVLMGGAVCAAQHVVGKCISSQAEVEADSTMLRTVESLLKPEVTSEESVASAKRIPMETEDIDKYKGNIAKLMETLSSDNYDSLFNIKPTRALNKAVKTTPGHNPSFFLSEVYKNETTRKQMGIIIGKGDKNSGRRSIYLNGRWQISGMKRKIIKYSEETYMVPKQHMLVTLEASLINDGVETGELLSIFEKQKDEVEGWVDVLDYLFLEKSTSKTEAEPGNQTPQDSGNAR